jgi:hypothetical protein
MARLLAGEGRSVLRRAGGGGRKGAGRGSPLRLGPGSLGRKRLLGFGEAVVRRLVEGKIHPRLDMEVEERLEGIAIMGGHPGHVSIL